MTQLTDAQACACCFESQHELHAHPAMRALEREVLGCDFGGTSWTTKSQADLIPAALGLGRQSHLLEIGAGTGWPGIYMAGLTGCDVTLLDVPVNSLKNAIHRAAEEPIHSQFHAVAASGSALPFKTGSFEAIGHSDVLCCLPDKLEMLKECQRIARSGARMLFYVIAPNQGITGADLDTACEVGPPFVGIDDSYENLLEASGWDLMDKSDLTGEYVSALSRLAQGMKSVAHELTKVLGREEFERLLDLRFRQISAIENGLLVREVFITQSA